MKISQAKQGVVVKPNDLGRHYASQCRFSIVWKYAHVAGFFTVSTASSPDDVAIVIERFTSNGEIVREQWSPRHLDLVVDE